ncbi:DUF732 domain-containing protein [Rhodococcus rhodochrous]|uniref:DUF732 domain-containing protein n=1 Tax=Rhodococcus rhodochrous TaxID=1829 RepID=UPI00177EAE31|nr:DUF732 domain-containing protein [Rhodococcus rhodochrous]QOH59838.1 hypothetical protein C6Y44_27480 [Rhodococcus rhodochrous]
MRKTILAVLAATTLAVTGCTATATAPAPTTVETPTSTSVPTAVRAAAPTTTAAVYKPGELRPQDRAFLANLNDWWRTADNATAIEGGESVCLRFNRGDDKLDILRDMIEIAGSENGINLMHAAVSAYCPQFLTGVK